jgi:hypothetical protein
MTDVDAEQRRHHPVLFAGALRPAQFGAPDQQRERRHQGERHDDDDDLQMAERDREPAFFHHFEAALDDRLQRLDTRALQELDIVLQEDRHADRRDQRRQPERAAQRPVGQALHGPAIDRGEDHRDQQDEEQGQRNPGHAERGEQQEGDQRDEGADHEDFAMREIDHADDPVDHRVSDRDQAVDGAERDAVDELLEEVLHTVPVPLPLSVVLPRVATTDARRDSATYTDFRRNRRGR